MELVQARVSTSPEVLQLIKEEEIFMLVIPIISYGKLIIKVLYIPELTSLNELLGEVTTFVGSSQGYADGNGKAARFNTPGGCGLMRKTSLC